MRQSQDLGSILTLRREGIHTIEATTIPPGLEVEFSDEGLPFYPDGIGRYCYELSVGANTTFYTPWYSIPVASLVIPRFTPSSGVLSYALRTHARVGVVLSVTDFANIDL